MTKAHDPEMSHHYDAARALIAFTSNPNESTSGALAEAVERVLCISACRGGDVHNPCGTPDEHLTKLLHALAAVKLCT